MTEGYGRDWTNWDAYMEHLWPKPVDVKYRNWQPFLSPKGRWMAFYGKSYTDINIIDLQTKELVVRDFYSRYRGYDQIEGKHVPRPDHVYDGGHCNVSTYVPSYAYTQLKSSVADDGWLFSEIEDYDFGKFDKSKAHEYLSNTESNYVHAKESRTLASIPLAFNAYTYWAADYCLFVDIIDLSKVDDGDITMFDKIAFDIPHGASHVRNYVDCYFEGENDPSKPFTCSLRFNVLKEEQAFDFTCDGKSKLVHHNSDPKEKPHNDLLPWQLTQKRQEEYQAKKQKENNNG